jgi:putative ABC transport system permease protein
VRTLVTIIGIVLSVALFTAVAEGAWSGRQYLVDVAEASVGPYHGMYDEISDAELAELKAQEGVREVAALDGVGWALAGDPDQVYPYLRISSMGEGFTDLVTVRLLEGRMPENDHELLISDRAALSTGAPLKVGQTLRLDLGRRETLDGRPLGERDYYLFEEEHLTETRTQEYVIVGMYDRFGSAIESYELPGTLVLTVGAPAAGTDHKAFFTLDRIGQIYSFLAAHDYGSGSADNRDLLLYSGVTQNNLLLRTLYGLAAILFGLIFLGSVALIYNSFSISVSERTKQFGLLKSIGATNRQMRRTVLMEALLLCVVGIPLGLLVGCGGIGLTLRLLRSSFDRIVNLEGAEYVSIRLALSAPALLLAAGIGLFTALVSAWIPARRATRLSPIAAIRQSADVKVRAKEVRVSKLTGKLFGFPGTLAAKNFKRSRKQYRSTVLSLFLSIVLFISAFSFADSLRQDVAGNANRYASDLIVYPMQGNSPLNLSGEEREILLRELAQTEGVTEAACSGVATGMNTVRLPASALTETAARWIPQEAGSALCYPTVYFVSDDYYGELCRRAGIEPAAGQAVAFMKMHVQESDGLNTAYTAFNLVRDEAFPLEAEIRWDTGLPGYYLIDSEMAPTGEITTYVYYPKNADYEADGSPREELILRLGPEDVLRKQTLTIGGFVEELPLTAAREDLSLYYPLSMAEALVGSEDALEFTFYFNAERHTVTAKAMTEKLKDLDMENRCSVYDTREGQESTQALLLVLNVFTFGFIVLISLIAAANVFNTISTNVALRRREFATLKSVGMGDKAFGRMMRFECLLYGSKALLLGLPVSIVISWLIWKAVNSTFLAPYRLPWTAIAIAAGSVFLVVFATMLYATGKIKKDNPIDALKQETL